MFKYWNYFGSFFDISGKLPSVIDLLNIITNAGIISSFMYFIIEILKMSDTDFLLWSKFHVISVTISISSIGFMEILFGTLIGR